MGSGFVLDEGTVLTNRHVVDGARTITVTAGDGTSIGVTSASESNFVDLGVVHVARTSVQGLRLADVDSPRGTTVSVVGYPLDGPLTTTGGQIAEYVVEPAISAVDPVLRLNVDLNPGNSGGPVVDGDGRVVGVAYASERSTGYGLAVPASTVRAALRDVSGLVPVAPC
jgi:S1-C subfamily serine protease